LAANTEIVIIRPNIEHQMLGIIMGQGGPDLGHTLWGQTELSCYDDSMHGIWGMSYKYHERAIVFNEKNLVRLWDVAYDGYVGGKDDTYVKWDQHEDFQNYTNDIGNSYRGPSMMVMAFVHTEKDKVKRNWPSPIVFHDDSNNNTNMMVDASTSRMIDTKTMRVFSDGDIYKQAYQVYRDRMPNFSSLHETSKPAGMASVENETSCNALAFQGTMKVLSKHTGHELEHIQGSGHHGPDWVGVASVRAGKGFKSTGAPSLQRMI
jgi:hypothetical protein